MSPKKKLIVFTTLFTLAFIYYRARVFLSFNNGEISFLRELTGLTLHHFHAGLILVLAGSLLLIFRKPSIFSIGLMGYGLGTLFDTFIARMIEFTSVRQTEITNYNNSFPLTIIVFLNIILLTTIFYVTRKN